MVPEELASTVDIFPTLLDTAGIGQVHDQQHAYEWSNLADNHEFADVSDRLMEAIGDWRESPRDLLLDSAELSREESKVNVMHRGVKMFDLRDSHHAGVAAVDCAAISPRVASGSPS